MVRRVGGAAVGKETEYSVLTELLSIICKAPTLPFFVFIVIAHSVTKRKGRFWAIIKAAKRTPITKVKDFLGVRWKGTDEIKDRTKCIEMPRVMMVCFL